MTFSIRLPEEIEARLNLNKLSYDTGRTRAFYVALENKYNNNKHEEES